MIEWLNTFVFGPVLPVFLLLCAAWIAVRLGRANPLLHPIRVTRGLFSRKENGYKDGISPFGAVTVALAGTLGVGNIAGVAAAIAAGGPGAVFWMILSAFPAMLIKYAEVVLAVHFRHRENGRFHGGTVRYLTKGLHAPRIAALFAVLCVAASFTLGSIVQVRAAAEAVTSVVSIPPASVGVVMAALVVLVIRGGLRTVSDVTVRLIPLLAGLYLFFSFHILWAGRNALGAVFSLILSSAAKPDAAGCGIFGFLLSRSIRFGVARGLFSNEAGCGTAPFAHAAADTDSSVRQGFFGIFEVFTDTVLLCSLTAIVILLPLCDGHGMTLDGCDGMTLAVRAYSIYLGPFAAVFLALSVFLFAFAALICWSQYASECLGYLTRTRSPAVTRQVIALYSFLYAAAAIFGSVASDSSLWQAADLTVSLMCLINTSALLCLTHPLRDLSQQYFLPKRQK